MLRQERRPGARPSLVRPGTIVRSVRPGSLQQRLQHLAPLIVSGACEAAQRALVAVTAPAIPLVDVSPCQLLLLQGRGYALS
jgi:hypothetical protein